MYGEDSTTRCQAIADDFDDNFGHLIGKGSVASKGRKRKKEGVYTTKLLDGFNSQPDAAADKIPDPVGSFKTVARPFDCIATIGNKCVVIEAKYFNGYQALAMSHLRDKQKLRLKAYHDAGALACVVAFYKVGSRVRMVVVPFDVLASEGTIKKRQIEAMPYDLTKKDAYPITRFRDLLNGQV